MPTLCMGRATVWPTHCARCKAAWCAPSLCFDASASSPYCLPRPTSQTTAVSGPHQTSSASLPVSAVSLFSSDPLAVAGFCLLNKYPVKLNVYIYVLSPKMVLGVKKSGNRTENGQLWNKMNVSRNSSSKVLSKWKSTGVFLTIK